MDLKKYAPRPARKGVTQAIWDELHTLGGADFKQLVKYMPAALTKEKRITKKQIYDALTNGRRRGYFISDKDMWRLAPISYWNSKEPLRNKQRNVWNKKYSPSTSSEVPETRELPDWLLIALGTSIFWAFLVGIFALGYFWGAP